MTERRYRELWEAAAPDDVVSGWGATKAELEETAAANPDLQHPADFTPPVLSAEQAAELSSRLDTPHLAAEEDELQDDWGPDRRVE